MHPAVLGVIAVGVPLQLLLLHAFLTPRAMHFNVSLQQVCEFSPQLVPGTARTAGQPVFAATRPAAVTFMGHPLLSLKVCMAPVRPFAEMHRYGTRLESRWLGLPFRQHISVVTGKNPVASAVQLDAAALPLAKPVDFQLSKADAQFAYRASVDNKATDCDKRAVRVRCDLKPLKLAYGTAYKLKLERAFHGRTVGVVTAAEVKTITAAAITASSIGSGATVYDKPASITFTANKPVAAADAVTASATVNGSTTTVPVKTTVSGTTITVTFGQELPRRAQVKLGIGQLTAADGSQLEEPYQLSFTTSGGPRVVSVNAGHSGLSRQPTFVIGFDQVLLASQAAAQLVSLRANGAVVAVNASVRGSQLIVTPSVALPQCAKLTLTTVSGIQNQYGVDGDGAWNYDSRVTCYTTFSLGTSVKGRAITGYRFGSGPSMVLYIASMHGNESNTSRLLDKWVAELNAYPDNIPANRTIVVVPEINPDGVAANTRENANLVDLNRNFPANNWQEQVTLPGGNGKITNEGGPSPLSEPESQAIAAFIENSRPRLVLTYHSKAGVVEANDAADSDALGNLYAAKSGYAAIPTYKIGTTFDYSTTGAMEDWMNDKLSLPALVVELSTMTNDEFYTNSAAMWSMAQLP